MLQNNIELDLKTKLIESSTTQTEVAEKVGTSGHQSRSNNWMAKYPLREHINSPARRVELAL